MKLHIYVDHQRLHIVTKDVISLSISVLLLFRHYISHKITLVPSAVAGYYAVLAVLLLRLEDVTITCKRMRCSLSIGGSSSVQWRKVGRS